MIPATLKLTRNHAETWDRHWAPGTMGHATPGRALIASISGIACDFMNENFIDEVDTVAGTHVVRKLLPASLINTLVAPLKYFIPQHSLALKAGSTTAGGVLATTGIIPHSTFQPRARGILNIALGDVNAASLVSIGSNGANWLRMDELQSWEVTYNLVYIVNPDISVLSGAIQLGVGSTDTDDDPANPIATRFCAFRIAANRIHLSDEATASIASTPIPDGPTSLTLQYEAGSHAINAYVNGAYLGRSPCNAAFVACGLVGRVYHLAAYVAAADNPLAVGIDSIVAINPPTLG
jgi:hypothetical protein